jgi:peroxiredoxin Q/BCP
VGIFIMHRAGRAVALAAVVAASLGCAQLGVGRQAPPPPLPPPPPALEEGAAAPDVAAVGTEEKPVRVSDYRGKALVLYFYPVDFSSSGTAAAEEFKADLGKYRKLGVHVVGVSSDHVSIHRDFAKRYKIPFPLLSDQSGQMARAFGVPVEGGTTRHYTFFIDKGGVIRKVWRNVRAWGHSAEVLAHIRGAEK